MGAGRSSMVENIYRVRVIDRALSIVNLLSTIDHLVAASEMGEALKLNKSTLHRLLAVLEQHRYVERDTLSCRYRLGSNSLSWGTSHYLVSICRARHAR